MSNPREQHPHGGGWLREIVFGLNDGLVTTMVFILAVSQIAPGQLVIVALGELFAGASSMGLGAFLSARTEAAIIAQRIATERYEIANEPEEEHAELRRIYYRKGFRGAMLEGVVRFLTADRGRWLDAMVSDELGIVEDEGLRPPWLQGLLVAASFGVGALIPILPFLVGLPFPQGFAYILTVLTAFGLGSVKARYTPQGTLRNSFEFLGIITVGAAIGLAIGILLRLLAK
jgi:VIT1/CCC1 family predicted Fe2+/Mn2+ transporter